MTTKMTSLFKIVLCEAFGSSAMASGILFALPFKLFSLHKGHTHEVSNARLGEEGTIFEMEVVRTLHNHSLPCERGKDLIVARTVVAANSDQDLAYFYILQTDDEVVGSLEDIFSR